MESKTVVYTPDTGSGSGSGMMAMLAPLLQQKGIDPNLLMALNSKGNGNGFGGDGSWFLWIIFLFFLFPLFGRNGWGNNGCNDGGNGGGYGVAGIPNLINNDAGRELLMSAIQGNGQAINTLATNLNCSVGQIQQSINGVMTQIQGVGNQVGMSSQQIINSIQSGNCQIAQAIADCCCKTQNAITTQGYENQLSICNQTNTLVNTANQNTLALRDGATANTQAILSKLDAMQNQNLLDKIDKLREDKSTLLAQISNDAQTRNNQAVPTGGEALPVTIAIPTSSNSTNVGSSSSNNGESKVNVIDHNSSNVIGSDITNSKEVFAFINKREGIIRFVNFQTGGTTPAPTSVASK